MFLRRFWNFISSLPVKRGGSLSFLVETISNVMVMEIGWTDVGSGGYILVSCAHSNTSYTCNNSFDQSLLNNEKLWFSWPTLVWFGLLFIYIFFIGYHFTNCQMYYISLNKYYRLRKCEFSRILNRIIKIPELLINQ